MRSAKSLLAECIRLLEPPPTMSLSDWTAKNRFLSSEESSIPGPYDPSFAPFQQGIMDCITDPDVERVCLMCSTRIGKTFTVVNFIGYLADIDPCPILYVRPRAEDCKNFSKAELEQLFGNTPCLQEKLKDNVSKESSNTLMLKQFPGGSIRLTGSNSPASLSGFAARVVLLDELDKFEPIQGFGHASDLAEGRTTTFPHNKKIIYLSSPSIAHTPESKRKTIHSVFLSGSQAYYHIPCPHCKTMQPLEWERLRFGHCRETLDDVYYECSECEGKITEAQKRIALLDGQWVHTYPDKPLKSFHVSQLYSPFCSFESIASEWLIVNASRDIYSIQRFKNEVLGLPFEDDLGLYRDSSDALFNRRERYLADVPLAASVLTMAVDTQDTWLSYTICGWGLDRECWIVRSGRIEGDPSTPGPWDALTQVLYAKYRHESGLQMGITQCLIDTQGHQTTHVNRWLKGKGSLVRGCYGARQPGKPIITKAKKDQHTGLRRWEIGTENAKTDIYQALTVTNPGPLFIHFPFECDEDYFKELYSERKVGSHFKQIGQRRNEKLDELVYNLACYYILLKNYTMEQRADLLQLSIQDLHEPDEPEDETEMVEERIIDQTLPQVEPEPKQPDLPTPERLLTARERYMAKIKGFNTTVQDGFKPLDRW